MKIQVLLQKMINAGIEENEAKYEIKMLLEHFCNYTELDKFKGRELTGGKSFCSSKKTNSNTIYNG